MCTLSGKKYLNVEKDLLSLVNLKEPIYVYKVNRFMFFIANKLPVSDEYRCVGKSVFSKKYKAFTLDDTLKSIFEITDGSTFQEYAFQGKLAVTIIK